MFSKTGRKVPQQSAAKLVHFILAPLFWIESSCSVNVITLSVLVP